MNDRQLLRIFGYTPETAGELKALNDAWVDRARATAADGVEEWVARALRLVDLPPQFLALWLSSAIGKDVE